MKLHMASRIVPNFASRRLRLLFRVDHRCDKIADGEHFGLDSAVRLRIAEERKRSGLTQKEFAQRLDMSQPYLAQIERGDRKLTTELQAKMAEVLGVDPGVLVDFNAPTPEDEARLLEAFRTLSPDRRKGWLDMARAAILPKSSENGGTN